MVDQVPGETNLITGEDQFLNFTLASQPGNEGRCTFRLFFKTPVPSFAPNPIPRSSDQTSTFTIVVLPPALAPESAVARSLGPVIRLDPE